MQKISELKITIELKNVMIGLYSRMEGTMERISEHEEGTTKIIQCKQHRETRLKTRPKHNKKKKRTTNPQ